MRISEIMNKMLLICVLLAATPVVSRVLGEKKIDVDAGKLEDSIGEVETLSHSKSRALVL